MAEKESRLRSEEKKIIEKERAIRQKLSEERERVFARFPLVFTLLGTFGLVSTFYGFEHLIDQSEFLTNNPWVMLGTGVAVLVATGSLYKKLQ